MFVPSFGCGVDGLANGPVSISTTFQLLQGTNTGATVVLNGTATAKNGVLEGDWRSETISSVKSIEGVKNFVFNEGCLVTEPQCDKAVGQKLRSQYLSNRVTTASGDKAIAQQPAALPAFSKPESIAFEALDTALSELLESVGSAGFPSEQAKIEAIVSKLGLSFYSGQEAAFGGDYTRMQSVQNAVRLLLAGKGAAVDANQLVDLVLGAVKGSLSSSRPAAGATPIAAGVSVSASAQPRPVAAPIMTAPQQVTAPVPPAAPTMSFVMLSSMPFAQRWSLRDVGRGCKAILQDASVMQDESGFTVNGQLSRFEWSGACSANGLAHGAGSLMVISAGELLEGRSVLTGAMNDGVLNGTFQAQDQENENGRWSVWSDDGGPRNYTMHYVNGCETEPYSSPCNAAYGAAMRANVLAGSARIAALPVAASRAPAPAPVVIASAIVIGPKMLSDIGALMVYPLEALRNEWQGRTAFSLFITATGAVGQCTITASSGFAVLDNETCALMQRASFSPALDGSGNPIGGTFTSAIRWQIP